MKKNHEIVKRIGLANRKQEAEIFEKKKKKKKSILESKVVMHTLMDA